LYATSGGQNADQGTIKINGKSYKLIDCIKGPNFQHFHCLNFVNPITIKIGDIVETIVDVDNRKIISAHHTCIHLLQKSLKLHVNQDIKQEGSLITNIKASIDFNYSQKLTDRQLEIIENQIND
jgi:alanyl-tRNA synthetase